MIICAGCDRPILDRYLLNVLDRAWHTRCVTCTDCSVPLTEKCFSRDGKLFCKNDFFIRFGTKCAGCTLGISPSDLVRKAKNKVFHLKCFTCLICRKELSTGEELYIMDEHKFICKDDYIASKLAGSDVDDDVDYECEKDAENDVDLDTKNDLYLDNADSNHVIRNNNNYNQLNNQFNDALTNSQSPGNPDTFLPPSPLGGQNGLPMGGKTSSLRGDGVPLSPGVKDEPMDQMSDSCPSPGGHSQDSSKISILNPGSNCSSLEANDNNNNKDGINEKEKNKRRGPRTTIKAKQLEVLKASFNATPKPTRHIREQLAAETGLNMRVIQVWFQNRRSKERRMKQLSALGARRHFFHRNPRRMRPLQPGELDEHELMAGGGYGYFNENGQDFYPGYIGHGYGGEFFPGQGPEMPPGMSLLPPHGRASPPMGLDNQMPPHPGAHMVPEAHYLHQDVIPHNPSPEPLMHPDDQYMMSLPPRSLPGPYPPNSAENWS